MKGYKEVNLSFLIADLAGYTSLTETHGNISAANLVTRYIDLVKKSLQGSAVLQERVGDEVLIISKFVSDLLDTASKLVQNIEQEPEFLSVHIGIHSGTVIEQDGHYFGNALNLCSRISSHSRGGQILCSEDVFKEANVMKSYQLVKVDDVKFKNISKPISVYEFVLNSSNKNNATDPVCKMQIDKMNSPAKLTYNNNIYHFCSLECLEIFVKTPDHYI